MLCQCTLAINTLSLSHGDKGSSSAFNIGRHEVYSRDFSQLQTKNFSRDHASNMVAIQKHTNISIVLELSSLNFNSSSAIHYPTIVIKSLCGNLDICLNDHANAYFQSRNAVRVISVADRDRR